MNLFSRNAITVGAGHSAETTGDVVEGLVLCGTDGQVVNRVLKAF